MYTIAMLWRKTNEQSEPKQLGLIHVYTGEGKGKSTAALGHALRALGHDMRVVVVHFLLSGEQPLGERELHTRLAPTFEYYSFGGNDGIDLAKWSEEDAVKAHEALNFCRELIDRSEDRPDVLILEDVNVVVSHGILSKTDALDFIENKPQNIELILTGRYAPPEFIERANIVTNMSQVKHYASAGHGSRKGVDY